MSAQEAIIKAQAALDKLKDGSYQILTKVIPATWGQLQIWLTSELARIKTEGGITVNPPEVVLPDGVQSTSQVTQSEMTQFVTNTLNTWLYSLQPQPEPPTPPTPGEGYDIKSLIYPEVWTLRATGGSYKLNEKLDVVWLLNSKILYEYPLGYNRYIGTSMLFKKQGAKSYYYNGVNNTGRWETGMSPDNTPVSPFILNSYNKSNVVVTYMSDAIAEDMTDMETLLPDSLIRNNTAAINNNVELFFRALMRDSSSLRSDKSLKMVDLNIEASALSEAAQPVNKNYLLVSLYTPYYADTDDYMLTTPLFQIYKSSPWFTSQAATYSTKIGLVCNRLDEYT